MAARHTLAHGPLDDAIRPVLIGRYAERVVDSLREAALQPVSLDRLASVQPEPVPTSLNDRLEAALHAWQGSAQLEIDRLIPSVDVLRQIANQGAHLCAVRASVGELPRDQATHLRESALALARGEKAWDKLTTLTRPSHEFVTASRELYETLEAVTKAASHAAGLDARRATHDLDRGLAVVGNLMTLTRSLPGQLLSANAIQAPAKSLRATDDRLRAREGGRYAHVRSGDVADLATAWETAVRSISGRCRVPRRDRPAEMIL